MLKWGDEEFLNGVLELLKIRVLGDELLSISP